MKKKFSIESCKKVNGRIQDSVSKEIYMNCIMYSLTDEIKYIDNIIRLTPEYQALAEMVKARGEAYIYGAGKYGEITQRLFEDYFLGFIDRDRSKVEKNGLKVMSIDDANNEKRVYVTPKYYNKEIEEELSKKGFREIVNVGGVFENLAKRQYFDLEELPHDKKECLVDVGAYDGDTTEEFIRWSNNKYDRIICLEPDTENVKRFKENIRNYGERRIELLQKGAWDEATKLAFIQEGGVASSISEIGTELIEVCRIDDIVGNQKVTYIKMDIEGAEEKALLGAQNTIVRYKPKLAICVYHKPEDIFTLPELLLNLNPEYKLYFRHYTFTDADTVMYAI